MFRDMKLPLCYKEVNHASAAELHEWMPGVHWEVARGLAESIARGDGELLRDPQPQLAERTERILLEWEESCAGSSTGFDRNSNPSGPAGGGGSASPSGPSADTREGRRRRMKEHHLGLFAYWVKTKRGCLRALEEAVEVFDAHLSAPSLCTPLPDLEVDEHIHIMPFLRGESWSRSSGAATSTATSTSTSTSTYNGVWVLLQQVFSAISTFALSSKHM